MFRSVAKTVASLMFACLFAMPTAHAAFGDVDCTWGAVGNLTLTGTQGSAYTAERESSGTILIVAGSLFGSRLYRTDSAGSTATFLASLDNFATSDARLALQPDGRIVFSTGIGVGRLMPDGTRDASFGTNGAASAPGLRAATGPQIQSDGRIVIGGSVNNTPVLARFNANGSLDTSFGSGGFAPAFSQSVGGFMSIAVQSDGYIVAADSHLLLRYRPDGSPDTTFGTGGYMQLSGLFGGALQVRIQPSGKIVVVGMDPNYSAPRSGLRVARFTSTGLDTSVSAGRGYTDTALVYPTPPGQRPPFMPMVMLPDGGVLIAGATMASDSAGGVARYDVELVGQATAPLDFAPAGLFAASATRYMVGKWMDSGTTSDVWRYFLADTGTIPTRTSVSSVPNPSNAARTMTMTATVTPASGSVQGCVQFKVNGNNVGGVRAVTAGQATLSLSNLSEGDSTVTAAYASTDTFIGSTSPPYVHNVLPRIATTTSIVSMPNPSAFAQDVMLTATVAPQAGSDTPTGTVVFMNDGAPIGAAVTLSGGSATLNTTLLRAGTRSLTAAYSGDSAFASSTSPPASHGVGAGTAPSAFGARDCTFGTNGVALLPVYTPPSVMNAVMAADGTLLVRGGQDIGHALFRATWSGAPLGSGRIGDLLGGLANMNDWADVPLPDGKVLYARADTPTSSNPYGGGPSALVRLLPSGAGDPNFGTNGTLLLSAFPTGGLNAGPILQPDGKILAGGGSKLIRVNADGMPDNAFGTNGVVTNAATGFASIALQPDGRIVALGGRLARYTPDGQLDTSFGTGGSTSLSGVIDGRIVRLQPSGHVLVEGMVPGSSPPKMRLARFTPTGVLDASAFGGTGYRDAMVGSSPVLIPTNSPVYSRPLSVMPDGRPLLIAAVGGNPPFSSPTTGVLIRYGADLSDDVSTALDFPPTFITVLPDGKFLVGRYSGPGGGELRRLLDVNDPPSCIATTTVMSSSPNPSEYLQSVTLTATVTPSSGTSAPTGTVQFKNGASLFGSPATLSSGVATLVTSSLPSGTLSLSAVYSGQGNVAASASAPVAHVVHTALTVDDRTVNVAAATSMTFTVTLSSPLTSTVTVDYATADHTAFAGVDYNAQSGTLTFAPGETTKTVVVALAPRIAPQANKDFFLLLSNPTNTTLAKSNGIGTITYASTGALTLFVDDPFVLEGYSGITLMGFTVTLSAPQSNKIVTVNYATANGTGTAGVDFTGVAGTIQFGIGETKHFVMVPVLANATPQPDRTVLLNLSGASGATIIKAQGTGTIKDDDPTPPVATIAQYRLYSPITNEHLYTTDTNEYAVLGTRGWSQEGTAYTMFKDGGSYGAQYPIPLYRMYHGGIQQHHWTTDTNEVMVLVGGGAWSYEGIAGYVLPNADTGTTPLYRLSYAKPPLHLWTTDLNEKDTLVAQFGWRYEGIVGEVLP